MCEERQCRGAKTSIKVKQQSPLCSPVFKAKKIMHLMYEQEQNAMKRNVYRIKKKIPKD